MEPASPARGLAMLHRFLGIGLVAISAVFGLLYYLGIAPLLPPGPSTAMIARVLSAVAVGGVLAATLFLKPRVPRRGSRESHDEYWSRPDVAPAVNLVWFLLEGAGIMAAVAFALTGLPFVALVMVLTIAAFWLNGPARFGRRREWE